MLGLLLIRVIKSKYVFIINAVSFFILFGIPHAKALVFIVSSKDFSFDNDYFELGFGAMSFGMWLVSFTLFNILSPILISFLPIGLHKSIFYEKTNSKY